jgi:hypothetical protein
MMSRGGRLVVVAIGLLAIALLGAFAGSDSAAATSVTQPVAAALPSEAVAALPSEAVAAPCVAQGVAGREASAQQQTVHHAGLVVAFPDHVKSFCIEFNGDSITGTELLQQSGLSIVFAGFGGLGGGVCRIDDVGCSDPGDCFCQCQGANCAYWSYFALEDGTWTYLSLGPAQHHVHDGDVDGWVWGNGHTAPVDARGPCPATPTLVPTTGAPPITPPPSGGGPSNGGQVDTPTVRLPVVAGASSVPPTKSSTPALATHTPLPQIFVGGAKGIGVSGGGVPVGLIAFGVVAGVLVAGIGGLALRRRLGG